MSKFIPISNWFDTKGSYPVIISGPCSAESEDQMLKTCTSLAQTGKVHMLRAGIWKPRTRPNSFEGVGRVGLQWLKKASTETGLPCCTEVANAKHVELCLKEGIDALWIGARTTVSPFTVQEIAEALKGTDVPVLIKNPINPDFKLWLGAIERFSNIGLHKIAAIHRGFSWFDKTPYRYSPRWEMPIELKTIFPSIDIICDPSHIAGKRALLAEVCQKAFDLEMSGLMIESHYDPNIALSDAAQQVTPKNLETLLNELVIRKNDSENSNFLAVKRALIDQVDQELVALLAKRMQLVGDIGAYKKEHNITILQLDRWKTIIANYLQSAKTEQLDLNFTKVFLELLHKRSIELQTEIFNSQNV